MNQNEKPDNPNRTRDHLANERTYLSWIRTAVALLGFGLLVLKLRPFAPADSMARGHGWELGAAFALAGLLLVPYANWHYFQVLNSIESDNFTPSRRAISWSSVTIFVIGLGVLIYLLFSASPINS